RELPALWPVLLGEVWAFLGPRPALRGDGHNVMLYRPAEVGGEVDVEIGVQVAKPFMATGRVVPSVLPATATATAVHRGPVDQIGAAHDAVRAWCAANDHQLSGTSWEIYGDPDATGHFDVTVHWEVVSPIR
ncbi:MAG: GyrI-like domain-containing protein, partial [Actinobacteria bacterium]|nr:GyrI-like domain-containing protein [Actinomycetota bacterium]